ncbi:MAG TPA: HAD-IC family P-type ATPase [Candidatus Microsaccharimonas sp.]
MNKASAQVTHKGLTSLQVKKRIERGQTNAFIQKTSRSAWSIIKANTFTLFNGIIVVCFIILIAIGHWQDIFFALSAFFNLIIGSIQEFRAKQALDKLALLTAQQVTVLRDGKEQLIHVSDIVIDDLLVLRAGDEVPADALVASAIGLQVDQSMLTGEADAIDKRAGNEVLSGSLIVAGTGYAVVSRVGEDSFANQFASEARRFSLVSSELRSSISKVLKFVAWAIGPVIILLLNSQVMALGGWSKIGDPMLWQSALVSTIASVVAMIPLGLVLITSISFAIGAVKLTRQQVLVKELAAVEGLARVDMICLDKTGTLTEGTIVFKKSHLLASHSSDSWKKILAWYALQPSANATARSLQIEYRNVPTESPVGEVQFSSARKWSAVSFGSGKLKGSWVLGGPEIVFLNGDEQLMKKSEALARTGQRTLVLAYSPHILDKKQGVLPSDISPVVLLSFQETIRSDASKTLAYFKEQGVAIRIISGDHPDTVAAIARRVGLDVTAGYDARQLPKDDAALSEVMRQNTVFGRVTPEQKQRMVKALQAAGYTVAMTGDGVNDTLAIKQADIGIAMNSGSAAAKAVARLVLLDGQFSHLPGVVEQGRQVIANVERISMLFLSKTTYAFGLAIVLSVMILPFPFLPRQESIIDGLTLGIPAFFLALLPNKKRYRPGFLKRSLSFAIPAGIIITAAMAVYTRTVTNMGVDLHMLQTGAVLLLTIMGLWILVVLSRPINTIKSIIIGAMMIGLLLVFSIPLVTRFLGFVDVNGTIAILITLLACGAIVLIEIVRFIHNRLFGEKLPKPRKLVELKIIAAVAYLSAFMTIAIGLIALFARYMPDLKPEEQFITTLVGVAVIMLGFLTISVASGTTRGDKTSRVILTVLLSIEVLFILVVMAVTEDHWVSLGFAIIVIAATIAVLWTGRRRQYFKVHRGEA